MDIFLMGLVFGLAIGVWISVAIIEWRLPAPPSLTRPQPMPASRSQQSAPPAAATQSVEAPPAQPPPVSTAPAQPAHSAPPDEPPPSPWAPAMTGPRTQSASTVTAPPASPTSTESAFSPQAQQLYTELLNMAKGDRALADRMVKYERDRAPQATTEVLISNAIDRWRHDNR